jgi:hypothetical protein
VSVLDGFYSTWDNARHTFGQGTPQGGAQYDKSGPLRQMGSDLANAAPGSKWSGAAAANYDAANTEHRRVIGQLAGLDQRLSQHVDQSAQVVTAGRQQLDAVRQWVTDAAATVPPGKTRDQMLMQIANKGIAQISEIVQKSNANLNTIAGSMRGLKGAYDALLDQKFAPREGGDFIGRPEDDKDPRRRAEKDVQEALAGDEEAAKRVEDVLGSIKPGQELTPEQASYLSQMQAQQNGMSVEELHDAEQRLGDHKDIIGDSWQLMSNDDVWFPKTDTTVGALDDPNYRVKGGFDQLPQSVQESLRNAGDVTVLTDETAQLTHGDDLQRISQTVQDGDQTLQAGTELDREMIRAADKVMDSDAITPQRMDTSDVVQGIFEASGRDHQIVHDHILGTHGDDGQDFMHDINSTNWNDGGKAAASLFSWTNESHTGPEATIAAATAEEYSKYIGSHKGELMNINGQTLGELNPELVKGYSHGLTPYMADIAGLSTADPDNAFEPIDRENPVERPVAKGIFSVLSTNEQAYNEFHSAANAHILAASHGWAEDVKNGVPVSANDARLLDSATLKALETVGTTEAARALGLNEQQVYDRQKAAYDMSVKMLSGGASLVPGVGPVLDPAIDSFGSAMESSVLGERPDLKSPTIADMDTGESARFALNALLANDVQLNEQRYPLTDQWLEYAPIDPYHPEMGTRPHIVDITQLGDVGINDTIAEQNLTAILQDTVGESRSPAAAMKDQYDDIVKNPEPNEAKRPGE